MTHITSRRPRRLKSPAALIPGLQAVAVSPDGKTLYGVNTSESLLVVANALDLTERQTFRDGQVQPGNPNPIAGLGGARAVAVSPDGNDVYVLGAVEEEIAIFARSATGDLVFQGAQGVPASIGSPTSLAVTSESGGSDLVFVGGTGGLSEFQGNTTAGENSLSVVASTTAIKSISSLVPRSDGAFVYATNGSTNAHYMLNATTLSLLQTSTSVSTTGSNAVAVALNPVMVGTLNATAVTGLSSTAGLFEGELVSGNGIVPGTTIVQINSPSAITLSQPASINESSSMSFLGDYPVLLGSLSGGSSLVTMLSGTASLYLGEPVTGAGIPLGTTIAKVNSSAAITLSQPASMTGISSLTFIDNYTDSNGMLSLSDFRLMTGMLNSTTAVTGLSSTLGLYEGEAAPGGGHPIRDNDLRDHLGLLDQFEPGRDDRWPVKSDVRHERHVTGRTARWHDRDGALEHGRVIHGRAGHGRRYPFGNNHLPDRFIELGDLEPECYGKRVDPALLPQIVRPQQLCLRPGRIERQVDGILAQSVHGCTDLFADAHGRRQRRARTCWRDWSSGFSEWSIRLCDERAGEFAHRLRRPV